MTEETVPISLDDPPDPPARFDPPRILRAGDAAFTVEFGTVVDEALNDRVLALEAAVSALDGVTETVPTYRSLLVLFDPVKRSGSALVRDLGAAVDALGTTPGRRGRRLELPVVYGAEAGEAGADLAAVADRIGLSQADLVEAHTAAEYRVHMIGFQPGYAYLGGLDARLAIPRRATPRPSVPAGSIAIAGGLAAVFSVASPSGWHLLGRTPVRIFDLAAPDPFALRAGDRIRFRAVTAAEAAGPEGRKLVVLAEEAAR